MVSVVATAQDFNVQDLFYALLTMQCSIFTLPHSRKVVVILFCYFYNVMASQTLLWKSVKWSLTMLHVLTLPPTK